MYGFNKTQRSTFSYWFAHWCAFQMVALNLHVWKFKYLFHDIEKPWLMLFWKDYKRVQHWHRYHNNHHIEWLFITGHHEYNFDIDAMIIDNECSRYTKNEAPLTAIQFFKSEINKITELVRSNSGTGYKEFLKNENYKKALKRAKELGLEK